MNNSITLTLLNLLTLLWSVTASAQEVRPIKVLQPPRNKLFDNIYAIAVSSNGKLLVSGYSNGELRLWTIQTGTYTTYQKQNRKEINSVAIDPKSTWIASLGREDDVVRIYNIKSKKVLRRKLNGGVGRQLSFSPNGKYLATASNTKIELWNVPSFERVAVLGKREFPFCLCFTPDEKILATGRGFPGFVKLWNLKSKRLMATIPLLDYVPKFGFRHCAGLKFLPNGQQLVIAWCGLPGGVLLWDLNKGKVVRHYPIQPSGINYDIALSPNGKLLAVSDENRKISVKVFDVATGKTLLNLPPFDKRTPKASGGIVAFSPDGRSLFTAVRSKIYMWDLPGVKK